MEKKVLSLVGAIATLAALAVGAYFVISKIVRKKGYCCEEVDFDNYVECPCDDSESVSIEDASTSEAEETVEGGTDAE